ncbi:PREDICTED: probable replication factor C subunit 1 [Cyphomyrmex costatus]|uniref:Uncharacterized protein n=1 Tax=Cyphomyrmex costatus TaxID=456900 RepID=A0A151I8W9_9HYME|nr:PREDICTED: probable replication factor C subunit 1 [Cyphomyrmex costatus]KYM95108.1 hypothetical protein ALC62_14264 [Cyphomyrmex costatus]
MARRRQAKQAATESVVTAADGNVTPPKRRRVAAKSPTADESKQIKGRSRQAKADEQNNEVASKSAGKSRSRQRNVTDAIATTAAAKTSTKSKSKKQIDKEPEKTTTENDNKEVAEKRTRGSKAAAAVKKAGKKVTVTKSKAKVPAARKQTRTKDAGNSAEDLEGKNTDNKNRSIKRPRQRPVKTVEENNVSVQPTTKVPRKRRNVEDTNKAISEAQTTVEEGEEEKDEAKTSKKLRDRQRKIETVASIVTSKERSRKNPVGEIVKSPPKKTEKKKPNSKAQNAAILVDNPKTKNVKNTKKETIKKAASKKKLNAVVEETSDDHVGELNEVEAATSEDYVKENGEVHMAEPKQKKRNVGKATATVNGKQNVNEAKGKQKKGQVTVSVDEKAIQAENEAIKMNVTFETDENDMIVSSSQDDNILENKEENDSKANSIKGDAITDISNNERSASFVCL